MSDPTTMWIHSFLLYPKHSAARLVLWLGCGFVLAAGTSSCYSPLVLNCSQEIPCPVGQSCTQGSCQCPLGRTLCGKVCISLQEDPQHCGACTQACQPAQSCVAGRCTDAPPPPRCQTQETLCGDVCTTMQSDGAHCGACNNACLASQTCVQGQCQCAPGHTRCADACVMLPTDPGHCGACGNACPGGQTCCQGSCSSQATPQPESCNGQDDDCDGSIDEDLQRPCYSGPEATRDVGNCKAGAQLCVAGQWQTCTGEVLPAPIDCGEQDRDCDGEIDPPCPTEPWHQTAGTNNDDFGIDVLADARGNVYVRGYTKASIQANKTTFVPEGDNRLFVIKYDGDGTPQWIVPAGKHSDNATHGTMSLAANGDLLLSGTFSNTITWSEKALTTLGGHGIFLARFSPEGKQRWVKAFDSNNDEVCAGHTTDAQGNIFLTGIFRNELSLSTQTGTQTLKSQKEGDVFLAKLNKDGGVLWAKSLSSTDNEIILPPRTDPADPTAVYVAGLFGQPLTCGAHQVSPLGNRDVYLARFDQQGQCLWLKSVGGSATETITKLHANNGAMIAGTFQGTAAFGPKNIKTIDNFDSFVTRFDTQGKILWTTSAQSRGNTPLIDIALSTTGHTYLLGTYNDTLVVGSQKITTSASDSSYIVALSPDGEPTWLQQFQRTNNFGAIFPQAIAVDQQGRVTLGGTFWGACDFAGIKKTGNAYPDIFLAHLSNKGATQWVFTVGHGNTESFGGLFIDPRDLIYMTGGYRLNPKLDNKTLPARGGQDLLVVKRKP